jgi:ParB family chromosome partitioning protein
MKWPAGETDSPAEPVKPLKGQKSLPVDLDDVAAVMPPENRIVPTASVLPNPDNPRLDFDEVKQAALVESIRSVGILEPLLVRHIDPPAGMGVAYQLLGGERRLKAAIEANVRDVPVRVFTVSDAQAAEILARENEHEELNPVEKARQYKMLMDRCRLNQTELARRFNVSQETVSNALQLLNLPLFFRLHAQCGTISPTHARELFPYLDAPAVADQLAKTFDPKHVPPVAEFKREVAKAMRAASRPMRYEVDEFHSMPGGCKFKPTPQQATDLDIRSVPGQYDGDRKEQRAFNTKLWNQLNNEAKAKLSEKNATKKDAARDKQDAERRARELGGALWTYKANWVGAMIGANLDPQRDGEIVERTLLMKILQRGESAPETSVFWKFWKLQPYDGDKTRSRLAKVSAVDLPQIKFDLVREFFAHPCESGRFDRRPADWLGYVADKLEIDLAKQWKPDEPFLAILSDGDRDNLICDEWPAGHPVPASTEAAELLKVWPAGFVPQILLWVNEEGQIVPPKSKKRKPKK